MILLLTLLAVTSVTSEAASKPPPVPGDCLPSSRGDGSQGLDLLCHLSAINSDQEKTNFSVVPAEHTVSLTVQCTDRDSVSHLEPRGFRSLVWLEELAIIDCNFQTIPDKAFLGLTRLKSLNIKSSTHGDLTFTRGSFEGLANLQSLDLSENNVRFPERGVLCSLPNLVSLNLSSSDLGDVRELGLSTVVSQANCVRNVRRLDLSRNRLTSLAWTQEADNSSDSGSGFSFPQIEKVDLSHNFLRGFTADSLDWLTSSGPVDLDMSNNQLSHLPSAIFRYASFRHLSLANNSLTSVPSDIFAHQAKLVVLDLSGNYLDSPELKPALFAETPALSELYLNDNRCVFEMKTNYRSYLMASSERELTVLQSHITRKIFALQYFIVL